jgi:hypothetical protein
MRHQRDGIDLSHLEAIVREASWSALRTTTISLRGGSTHEQPTTTNGAEEIDG